MIEAIHPEYKKKSLQMTLSPPPIFPFSFIFFFDKKLESTLGSKERVGGFYNAEGIGTEGIGFCG